MFSGIRWLNPDEPTEVKQLESGLARLTANFPQLGRFPAGELERLQGILRRNRTWWEQSAWRWSRRRRPKQPLKGHGAAATPASGHEPADVDGMILDRLSMDRLSMDGHQPANATNPGLQHHLLQLRQASDSATAPSDSRETLQPHAQALGPQPPPPPPPPPDTGNPSRPCAAFSGAHGPGPGPAGVAPLPHTRWPPVPAPAASDDAATPAGRAPQRQRLVDPDALCGGGGRYPAKGGAQKPATHKHLARSAPDPGAVPPPTRTAPESAQGGTGPAAAAPPPPSLFPVRTGSWDPGCDCEWSLDQVDLPPAGDPAAAWAGLDALLPEALNGRGLRAVGGGDGGGGGGAWPVGDGGGGCYRVPGTEGAGGGGGAGQGPAGYFGSIGR
jgi:hypothetical protein